jgi:protein-disulfide isomerase
MSDGKLTIPVGSHDHIRGNPDASVTLLEYGDFECPHCFAAFPVLRRVEERLGEKLRFVFRNFPITEVHRHAQHAAEAAESVAVRGGAEAYWAMHDLIYTHQQDSASALDDAHLARYAREAGVELQDVLEDLRDQRYYDKVRADFMGGVRSGVNGTPTLFIDGIRYDGPRDEETLVTVLELVARNNG